MAESTRNPLLAPSLPTAAPTRAEKQSWCQSGSSRAVVLHRLFETFPNIIRQVDEFGIAAHRFGDTRPRQRHVEDLSYFPRSRRHYDDPVRKINRFIHAMGNEDHRLAFTLPQLQQFLL